MTTPTFQKSVHVPLPPGDAFDLFTARIAGWWPGPERLRFVPGRGGRLVEDRADGTVRDRGRVVAWDPGAGFLAFEWTEAEGAEPTVVTVAFVAEGNDTRVSLSHGTAQALLGAPADAISRTWLRRGETVLGCYAAAVFVAA